MHSDAQMKNPPVRTPPNLVPYVRRLILLNELNQVDDVLKEIQKAKTLEEAIAPLRQPQDAA